MTTVGTAATARTAKSVAVIVAGIAAAGLMTTAPAAAAAPGLTGATAAGEITQPTGPTTAVAYNCGHGIRTAPGYPNLYYAWAICRSGSGYYRVGFGCQYFSGEEYWVWGPTRRVGEGESRGACHAHTRPTATTVQSWT